MTTYLIAIAFLYCFLSYGVSIYKCTCFNSKTNKCISAGNLILITEWIEDNFSDSVPTLFWKLLDMSLKTHIMTTIMHKLDLFFNLGSSFGKYESNTNVVTPDSYT